VSLRTGGYASLPQTSSRAAGPLLTKVLAWLRRTALISVTVIRKNLGVRLEAGKIKFAGILIVSADGSTRIPVDAENERIPFSFQCNPPDLVSDESAQRIADELSRGFGMGKVGEVEWRAD
jgi:hypothetical protein